MNTKTRHTLHISKPSRPAVSQLEKIGMTFRPTIELGPMILAAVRFAASRAAEFRKFIAGS